MLTNFPAEAIESVGKTSYSVTSTLCAHAPSWPMVCIALYSGAFNNMHAPPDVKRSGIFMLQESLLVLSVLWLSDPRGCQKHQGRAMRRQHSP